MSCSVSICTELHRTTTPDSTGGSSDPELQQQNLPEVTTERLLLPLLFKGQDISFLLIQFSFHGCDVLEGCISGFLRWSEMESQAPLTESWCFLHGMSMFDVLQNSWSSVSATYTCPLMSPHVPACPRTPQAFDICFSKQASASFTSKGFTDFATNSRPQNMS